MAVIAVNERFVRLARVDQSMTPAVSGEPLDAGDYVSQGTDGRYVKGGTSGGVVVETVLTANAPISVLRRGILDLGSSLQEISPGTPVYGTPAGVLDTTATGNTPVGIVEAGRGDLNGDPIANGQRKYLRVEA